VTSPREDCSLFASRGLAANLTLLFTEYPLVQRPAAAKAAGFDHVEFWWPFGAEPAPHPDVVTRFVSAVQNSGVQVVAMNLFAGDMPNGERGVLSYPEHVAAFRQSVEIAMDLGERLGIRLFNAPYGHRRPDLPFQTQDEIAIENIVFAMKAARRLEGAIMMEPLSGMPQYPLKTADDAVQVIKRARDESGLDNLLLLLDQYHLAVNGEDLSWVISEHGELVGHVQIADVPGRGEPGSGSADIQGVITSLVDRRYRGLFALEYIPADSTEESLRRLRAEVGRWTYGARG
jgi:hydroxypyruvate isomerase